MKVTNTKIYGLEESIVASGYPMLKQPLTPKEFQDKYFNVCYSLKYPKEENKDINRAIKLAQAPNGSGHDNFLKGIIVQFDCNAPQYFWQQLQRYNFVYFVSSMSKMHRIMDLAENKDGFIDSTSENAISNLEDSITAYSEGKFNIDDLLCNVPMGLTYTARLSTNYLQLKTIYKQRRQHRSNEWQDFCDWIETLPMAQELIVGKTFKNELHYTEGKK